MALTPSAAGGAPIPAVPGSGVPTDGGAGVPSPFAPPPNPGFGPVPEVVSRMYRGKWGDEATTPYATAALRREFATKRAESSSFLSDMPGGVPWIYTGKGGADAFQTIDDLLLEFESKSPKQQKKLAKMLAMAGYLTSSPDEASLLDVGEAYAKLLEESSARFAQGQDVTPDSLMKMNIRYNVNAAGADLDGDPKASWWDKLNAEQNQSQARTTSTTSTQRDIWNAEDARGLARAMLQQELGRDPSEAEYEDFVTALQTHQRQNPTTTTTRQRYNANGDLVSSKSTSEGGSNPQEFAQQYAESQPGWAEWQAVGTYFPALMSMLGSQVPNNAS